MRRFLYTTAFLCCASLAQAEELTVKNTSAMLCQDFAVFERLNAEMARGNLFAAMQAPGAPACVTLEKGDTVEGTSETRMLVYQAPEGQQDLEYVRVTHAGRAYWVARKAFADMTYPEDPVKPVLLEDQD